MCWQHISNALLISCAMVLGKGSVETRVASLHEHHKLLVFDNSERTVILHTPSGNMSTEKSVERKIK